MSGAGILLHSFTLECCRVSIRIKAFVLAACLAPTTLLASFEARWQVPKPGTEELFAGALRDSGIVKDALKLGTNNLKWPDPLVLAMGGTGLPRYIPATHTVHIPYGYLASAVRAQYNFEESRATALKRGLDVVEYTLYHLLGHALHNNHSVDIDHDVEVVSTWLMVSSFENGGEQWLADIEAFSRASQKLNGPLDDYWHDHGLAKRPAMELNCLVVGSDPQRYLEHYPGLAESPEKTAACAQNWRDLEALIKSQYQRAAE